ncbi:MAG: hypothetical protein HY700_12725 [Gemmatimonadetes bacterium]|nr:hypothetical protein [Gemmatimonadota bacterium]
MSIVKRTGVILLCAGLILMAYANEWVGATAVVLGSLVVLGSARERDGRVS